MEAGISTQNAPSPRVVLPHYIFGALAFLVSMVLLFFAGGDLGAHYFSPHLLSLTHVMVLGWISMIIFGALYQLLPVLLEVKLHSEKLALATFVLFGLGLILLSLAFWNFTFQHSALMDAGGTFILIAVVLLVINIMKTTKKAAQKSIESLFIVSATHWLALTVVAGLLIVFNFSFQFIPGSHLQLLKIHAHIGMVGWFLLLVIGVSSKLMPMFLIVHKLSTDTLKHAFFLINGGLLALIVALYFYPEPWLLSLLSLVVVAGVVLYLRYNFLAFKKRLRKKLDVGMRLSAIGLVLLAVVLLLGIVSAANPAFLGIYALRIKVLYGVLIIIGFLTALVVGQTYKTLPFIVWLRVYHSKVGRQKTPLPQELYSGTLAVIHLVTYVVGILLLATGILLSHVWLIQLASIFLIVTALLYNINVFKIVFHKEKKL